MNKKKATGEDLNVRFTLRKARIDAAIAIGVDSVALHEASHAVVSIALGTPVELLSLRPGRVPRSGRPYGAVVLHPQEWLDIILGNPLGHREDVLRLAEINLSAVLVATALDREATGIEGDISEMLTLISPFAKFASQRTRLTEALLADCTALIERHWSQIVLLAQVAEKRLEMSGEEIMELIASESSIAQANGS